jgi:pimeloyl-ACP methyl ester carboxylesterase
VTDDCPSWGLVSSARDSSTPPQRRGHGDECADGTRFDQIACPTLVIHGEADAPVPVGLAESIVAAMPNARLEVIPAGGHRPDIRTPELVDPLLLDFLLDE